MICVHLRWRNENLTHYFMLFPCLAQDLQQQLGGGGRQLSCKGTGGGRRGRTRPPPSRDGDPTELDQEFKSFFLQCSASVQSLSLFNLSASVQYFILSSKFQDSNKSGDTRETEEKETKAKKQVILVILCWAFNVGQLLCLLVS